MAAVRNVAESKTGSLPPHRRQGEQRGQAMAEAVVGVLVLGVLLHVVAATDRVQDLALRASMAGRYAAMLLTRDDSAGTDMAHDVRQRFFAGPRHRWQTRQGDAMLADVTSSVRISVGEQSGRAGMQVGQHDVHAATLRQEVLRRDRGIAVATVDVTPRLGRGPVRHEPASAFDAPAAIADGAIADGALADGAIADGATADNVRVARRAFRPLQAVSGREREHESALGPGLDAWEATPVRLRRHTAILTDAGHAASDRGVTERLQHAPQTWAASAGQSIRVGSEVTQHLSRIDRPWGRPLPQFDWLTPWETLVPADRLTKREGVSWDR